MSEPERKKPRTRAKQARASRRPAIRDGGTHLSLFNSGLEVWLYDNANADTIRDSGALDFRRESKGESFEALTKRGMIVGYSLHQDDELEIAVYVGDPLSETELSMSRWLEPQTAFLRVPSGRLCVEPNDSCRVGPETPTEKGGVVDVPPGDYRVTLYRVDHEALFREQPRVEGRSGGRGADRRAVATPMPRATCCRSRSIATRTGSGSTPSSRIGPKRWRGSTITGIRAS